MGMNNRLLRPKASSSTAIARDSNGNIIQPVTYSDGGVNYVAHVFTSSGTLQFSRSADVEYLIVAGGGGGSGAGAIGQGGGGAGGLLTNVGGSPLAVTPQTYTVTVGAGGTGGVGGTATRGNDGNASSFAGVSATGGGGAPDLVLARQSTAPQQTLAGLRPADKVTRAETPSTTAA
jgi:hypothetical protein